MRTIILLIILIYNTEVCFGQCHDTIIILTPQQAFDELARGLKVNAFISPLTHKEVYTQQVLWCETTTPIIVYNEAGIKKQPIDSSKYFYRRFLKLKSQGVADSENVYKQKLLKYKKNKYGK